MTGLRAIGELPQLEALTPMERTALGAVIDTIIANRAPGYSAGEVVAASCVAVCVSACPGDRRDALLAAILAAMLRAGVPASVVAERLAATEAQLAGSDLLRRLVVPR